MFWIEEFTGLQFTVIFRRFFKAIIETQFINSNDADIIISDIATNKFLIYPFISTQKEFGYSDVTVKNNTFGYVENLFIKSEENVMALKNIDAYYNMQLKVDRQQINYKNVYIPTYIINLSERIDRLAHIKKQFDGKSEFNTTVIEAIKNEKGNLGLWLTIRKIIMLAVDNDDDVIIICEDDHEFTNYYSKYEFLKILVEAHMQGIGIVLGGIGDFGSAVYLSQNKFWINSFFCTQFTVIFKNVFLKILNEPFDETVTADGVLSEITSNKIVIHPFISIQKFLGSNINYYNEIDGYLNSLFNSASNRLNYIKEISIKYRQCKSD